LVSMMTSAANRESDQEQAAYFNTSDHGDTSLLALA